MGKRTLAATLAVATGTVLLGPAGASAAAAGTPPAATGTAIATRSIASETARISDDVEIIAHRGGIVAAPENTMSAIKHAIAAGADAIELDVRFSSDGGKAVFHDETLDRTTDCRGRVDRKTWKELKKCDAGSWFSRAFRNEDIPSLNRALRKISRSDLDVYLHVKDVNSKKDAESIMRAVKRNGMNNKRTILFASNGRILDRLDAGGAKGKYIGKLFTRTSGWKSKYRTLIPYNTPITKGLVREAQRGGHKVIAVEGHPLGVADLRGLGLDGFMADRLGLTLTAAGRLLS